MGGQVWVKGSDHVCANEHGEDTRLCLRRVCSPTPCVLHQALCWDGWAQNQSWWEGLLGREPPEGISAFIKHGDGDLCLYKLHQPCGFLSWWPGLQVHSLKAPPPPILPCVHGSLQPFALANTRLVFLRRNCSWGRAGTHLSSSPIAFGCLSLPVTRGPLQDRVGLTHPWVSRAQDGAWYRTQVQQVLVE